MLGHELTGYLDATGRYVETVLSRQFAEGGLTCLDEHDGGSESAPLVVNAMLANGWMSKGSSMVRQHADWRVIATANTVGGATAAYSGRVRLDQATLQRYALVHVDYVASVEESIAGGCPEWLKLCRAARAEVTARGLPIVSGSYRDMANGMRALAAGATLADCVEWFLVRATLDVRAITRAAGVVL
jgi:cobaltochelatase CobS